MSGKLKKEEGLAISHEICFELIKIVDKLCQENNITYWIDGGTLLGAVRHKGFIPWDDDIDLCFPKKDYDRIISLLKHYCQQSSDHVLYFSDANFPYWCESFANISYLIDGVLPVRIDLIPVKFVENTPETIAFDKSITNVAMIYVRGKAKDRSAILDIHKKHLPKRHDISRQKEVFFQIFNQYLSDSEKNISPQKEYLVNYCYNDVYVTRERPYYKYSDIFPISKIQFLNLYFNCPSNSDQYLTVLYGKSYMELPPPELRTTHFSKMYKNPLKKKDVKNLLDKLHHHGFQNLGLGKKNQKHIRKILQIKSFFILFFSLVLKLKLKSIKNLCNYSLIRSK